jgi:hypothetical protein
MKQGVERFIVAAIVSSAPDDKTSTTIQDRIAPASPETGFKMTV